ncbi:MAG: TetR family transcriptional regulator C-terminal domain-containing protein [Burkholderiaceae bacterium]|nr:TetR family transcriptional regulator C-terminal domain-containing protein [Burkholderiaceae bacterium]
MAARRPRPEGARPRTDSARGIVADDGTTHATKQRLLDAGMAMLLRHGYNDLGIAAVLSETNVPKGSFYHHFHDKEDFALQVIDQYMRAVHAGLDACLGDRAHPPLERVRRFFEATRQSYRSEGYLGCLLGGLGQELSGVNDVFRQKIDWCFSQIAERLAACLEEAQCAGDVPAQANPREMANRLVDCWEGAALRSRLRRDPAPLDAMLDFYFGTVSASLAPRPGGSLVPRTGGRRSAHGRPRSS